MCGIIGIVDNDNAIFPLIALGLHHLQHRGQDSCGITIADNGKLSTIRESSLVNDAWGSGRFNSFSGIKGIGIGHVRYPTVGTIPENRQAQIAKTQPFQIEIPNIGPVAMVHNGNLVNTLEIREFLVSKGINPRSEVDSEIALQLLLVFQGSLHKRIVRMCEFIKGGFTLCIITPTELIGVRDSSSNRPLVMGEKTEDDKKSYMFASETCALDVCGFNFVKELDSGEVISISRDTVTPNYLSFCYQEDGLVPSYSPCAFENVYFARPDSIINGQNVAENRINLGKILAKEHSRDADLVIGIPDSGVLAGFGYSQISGIPFHPAAIIRNHYIGRTFIAPSVEDREFRHQMKLTVNKSIVDGKKMIFVDDSAIRGSVSKDIVTKAFLAGAKEVHLLLTWPPFRHPCRTGIATKGYDELIANGCNTVADVEKKLKEFTGADSVGFISLAGMYLACGKIHQGKSLMCDACFTGNYPVKIPG